MRIKRFVQVNIVLSILLLSLLYGLSWVYVNYVNDRTVKFMEYNKLPDNSVDLVVLGSSHGKFGIKVDKPNQMNLALEQQGIYYSLKLLEKYQNKIKDGATIIFPISIFTFNEGKIDSDMSKDEVYKNYINLLNKKEIRKPLNISQYFLMNKFAVIYPPSRLVTTLNWGISCIKEGRIIKNKIIYNSGEKNKKLFERQAKKAVKGYEKQLENEDYIYSLKISKELLEKMNEKNLKLIVILVPLSKEYNEAMELSKEKIFEKAVYDNIEKLKKISLNKLIFLDYSKDGRFQNNIEYFMDDDHLNEKGAEYFTDILLKDIDERIKKNE